MSGLVPTDRSALLLSLRAELRPDLHTCAGSLGVGKPRTLRLSVWLEDHLQSKQPAPPLRELHRGVFGCKVSPQTDSSELQMLRVFVLVLFLFGTRARLNAMDVRNHRLSSTNWDSRERFFFLICRQIRLWILLVLTRMQTKRPSDDVSGCCYPQFPG